MSPFFSPSAVRFPRKTIEKVEGHSTFLVWLVYGVDVLDEAVRGGEAKNAPARHAPQDGCRYLLFHSFDSVGHAK
jgi:hypothetical protein